MQHCSGVMHTSSLCPASFQKTQHAPRALSRRRSSRCPAAAEKPDTSILVKQEEYGDGSFLFVFGTESEAAEAKAAAEVKKKSEPAPAPAPTAEKEPVPQQERAAGGLDESAPDTQMAGTEESAPLEEAPGDPELAPESVGDSSKTGSTGGSPLIVAAANGEEAVSPRDMKVADLRELCKQNNLKGYHKMRKQEMLDMLRSAGVVY